MEQLRSHAPLDWRLSRRRLLQYAGMTGIATALLFAAEEFSDIPLLRLPPLPLLLSSFARFVGDALLVEPTAGVRLRLELVQAQPLKFAQPGQAERQFELRLRGALWQPLRQGSYPFSHYRIGAFPLFIVPMGVDTHARYYEAIFNQLAS